MSVPTVEQLREFKKMTKSEWTVLNGVEGRKYIGPNGNSIFIPASGNVSPLGNGSIFHKGYCASLWSGSEISLMLAYRIYIDKRSKFVFSSFRKKYELFVRPVVNRG